MGSNGLQRFKRDSELLHAGLELLELDGSWDAGLTKGLARAIAARYDRVIECAETGRPFAANSFGIAPEIFAAMDLPWYVLNVIPFLPMAQMDLEEQVDAAAALGLRTDLCSVIRVCIQYVYGGCLPTPAALVGTLSPCDGAGVLNQAIARSPGWRDVPVFCFDPPYRKGDRALDYFSGEMRRMVDFLARRTGAALDLDRLRAVVSESNRQHQLWSRFRCLAARAAPCPRSVVKGAQAWHVAQNFLAGDPLGTDWFGQLLRLAEEDLQAGRAAAPQEKIRLLWFDIRPVLLGAVTDWLRDEWGACIVMDLLGYAPVSPIDTSTESSMLRGLAQRWLSEVPIVRQAHGAADLYAAEICRMVEEYAIDCVVWPGHMGHKDGGGSTGIARRACAELGVSFLHLELDLLDSRCTPVDDLKDKFSRFFSVKGLG